MRTLVHRMLASAALVVLLAGSASAAATIVIINMDGPGEGFNDPTAAAPIGGNPGTTIGQQRLNCFQHAANIWGGILTSSVTIQIQAAFNPLTCTSTSAVLGSAGPRFVEENAPGAEFPNYWYHEALACKEAGVDLTPIGSPSLPPGDNGSDINAQFNSNLGNTGCLDGSGWYYGFDHNEGLKIDLVAVLEHEFAHGLGFSTTTNGSSGNYLNGPPALPAVWDKFLFDETTGLHWDQNSAAQRQASAINTNNLVWDGAQVTSVAPNFLSPAPEVVVPFGAGFLEGNSATFGPALDNTGVTAQVILVNDGVGTTTDGCETPFVNAGQLAGRIAVIDRGTCAFTAKALNAQNNGAIGVILINNTAGPLAPAGTDPSVTIPTIGITLADGNSLKAAIAGGPTTVTIRLSSTRRAGMQPSGRVRMYAPNPIQSGSSVSHWDVSLTPNALMEPAINPDLSDNVDLTEGLFRDIGWLPHLVGVPVSAPSTRIALAGFPNPTRGAMSVHFVLPTDERVELVLFDVSGRQVRRLAHGTYTAGAHDLTWDGRDAAGRPAAPGVYLARLKGTHTNATEHLVLVQ